jgi:SAM-dependent methyltransferase
MSCSICGGIPEVVKRGVRDSEEYEVYKCGECGTGFLYPVPEIDYQTKYFAECGHTDPEAYYIECVPEAATRIVEVIDSISITCDTRLLEVGCGVGAFATMIAGVCNVSVVEPYDQYREWIRGRADIDIYHSLDSVKTRFDCVVMFHVLEHVPDPISFLHRIGRLTDTIYIEVPNYDDRMLSVDSYRDYFYQKAHSYYLNRKSMRYIAEEVGMTAEIKYKQRYNMGNHKYWIVEGKPGGNDKYPELVRDFGYVYDKALIDSGTADTMICTLRR